MWATWRSALRLIRLAASTVYLHVRFIGRSIYIHPTSRVSRRSVIRVTGGGSIRVGPHCEIHDYAMILTYGGAITIGDHCSVNPFSIVYGHGGTRIGAGVRIAAHTVIIPANHVAATDDTPLFRAGVTTKGIVIGDDVWIGAGCRILDDVTIGEGCIVGAGSVVTRSLPPHTTAAGVPARVIREGTGARHER